MPLHATIFLLIAACLPLSAQLPLYSPQTTPNAPGKRYAVAGTVVNSQSGAPLARAVVSIYGQQPSQTFTDDNGHFEFKDVPEGQIAIVARRPGFQPQPGRRPSITVGPASGAIELKVQPESSLRGRVVNSDGEPVEGARIELLRQQVMNGTRDWMPANGAQTDETGSYLVENIPPGVYLVHLPAHSVFRTGNPIVVDGRRFPDLYLPQYFPNAPDRASAQTVVIAPGSEAQADFSVTAVPSYSATGAISGAERGYTGECISPAGEVLSRAMRVDSRRGQFIMSQLPAGSCTLVVQTGGRPLGGSYGELPIAIGSTDVNGLQMAVQPLPEIPVIFSGGDVKNPSAPGANVSLASQGSSGPARHLMAIPKDGALFLSGVVPGTYRVAVQSYGAACVGSVSSGSIDLLHNDLTVSLSGAPAPITVDLRNDCGSITGKVENADSASVIAMPEGQPALAKIMNFGGGSNSQNSQLTIQISQLAPGAYILYAALDLSAFPYADPETLRQFSGQKVTVPPSGQASVQLKMMNWPGESK